MGSKKGFTLIELITVIGISIIMVAITGGLFRNSQKTLDLVREQTKLASLIEKAKALSVSIFNPPGLVLNPEDIICGYGVLINSSGNNYILYADIVQKNLSDLTKQNCAHIDSPGKFRYDSADYPYITEKIDSPYIKFDSAYINSDPNASIVADIFFEPPKPHVHLYSDTTSLELTAGITQGIIPFTSGNQVVGVEVNRLGLVLLKQLP